MTLKFFNFRAFLVTALLVGLSVFFALLTCSIAAVGIMLFALQMLLVLSGVVFYASNKESVKLFTYITAFVCCVFSYFAFIVTVNTWTDVKSGNDVFTIQARVESVSFDGKSSEYLLGGLKIDGKNKFGKINLSAEGKTAYSQGDTLNFKTKLYKIELIKGMEFNGTAYRQNLRYRVYLETENIVRTKGNPNFMETFQNKIQNTLVSAMGLKYGNTAFAMLTGDKNGLTNGVSDYFGTSGLGHLMAVSGLHIGFLSLVLNKILRLFRLRASIRLPILTLGLFLYAAVAGFSPSVMRAVLMCIIGFSASLFGKRNDKLNTLALVFTVIITFFPGYLFEAGFVLSICSVSTLVLFAKRVSGFFNSRLRLPKKIANTLSATLCVQAGVIPPMIFFFEQVQIYSFFVNLFVLPLFMFVFIAILLLTVITLLIPPLSILLKFSGLFLAALDTLAQAVAKLPFSSVAAYSSVGIFSVFVLYLFASKYFILNKHKAKVSALLMTAAVIINVLSVGVAVKPKLNSFVAPVNSFKEVTSVLDTGDGVIVVGEVAEYYALRQTLYKLKVSKIKGIYLFSLTDENAENIINLSGLFQIDKIYCPVNKIEGGFKRLASANMANKFHGFMADESLPDLRYSLSPIPVYIFSKNINILFVPYKGGYSSLDIELINSADIIRCALFQNAFYNRVYITNYPKKFLGEDAFMQLSLADLGEFSINYELGYYVAI